MIVKCRRSFFALFITLALGYASVGLSACGSTSSCPGDTAGTVERTEQAEQVEQVGQAEQARQVERAVWVDADADGGEATETETETSPESKFAVTIDGARVTTNSDGDPAVIITYTFTNNSDETKSFDHACDTIVFQKGVECDRGYGRGYDSDGYYQKVKPGATTTCELMYNLKDTTSPIEVEVEDTSYYDDVIIAEKTFTLQ